MFITEKRNRVSKTVNGNTCKYLYEYDKIVLETDGEGNQTARNVYGTNLITRESNDKKYTYHYNGHGDVTALTEKSGNIAAAYEYDPFGNITGETENIQEIHTDTADTNMITRQSYII